MCSQRARQRAMQRVVKRVVKRVVGTPSERRRVVFGGEFGDDVVDGGGQAFEEISEGGPLGGVE